MLEAVIYYDGEIYGFIMDNSERDLIAQYYVFVRSCTDKDPSKFSYRIL